MRRLIIYSLFICLNFAACKKNQETIRLNDVQLIASHNSYKIAIEKPLLNYLLSVDSAKAIALDYSHIPVHDQLRMGLRSIELDVFYDPEGGHYSNPKGLDLIRNNGGTPLVFDADEKLNQPGLKLFHIQDIDFRSHHLLFKDCLAMMKKWSEENPDHTPVFILINTKDQKVSGTKILCLLPNRH